MRKSVSSPPHHKTPQHNKTDTTCTRLINTQIVESQRNNFYLPVIDTRFAGQHTTCLLDSGACVSVATFKLFEKIKHDPNIKRCENHLIVKSISGEELNVVGCYIIPITIGEKRIRHPFYVVKDDLAKHYQAIIGYDLLKKFGFSIHLNNNTLEAKNLSVKIRDANSSRANNVCLDYARLQSKLTLNPHESRIVNLAIDMNVKPGQELLFNPTLRNDRLNIQSTLCTIGQNKTIPVLVANITSQKVAINKHTKVGSLTQDYQTRDMQYIKELRKQELKPTDFNLSHLDDITKSKLLKLIFEFSDIFSKRLFTIGRTDKIYPILEVDKSKLPNTRPYPVPQALRAELQTQLKELLDAHLIEESDAPNSSPLILIKKKNNNSNSTKDTYRVVYDFRKVNQALNYPRYKLPIINHLLENLRGSKLFCSLDMSSSFNQIELLEKDRDLTTFSTPYANYRCKTMPQGLSASPETFARLSDKLLSPILDLKISNYIDDFGLGSENVDEMLFKLRKLFERFREFGLTLNPRKCTFLVPEMEFLGHHLTGNGIKPIESNIRKIIEYPSPSTRKRLRRFLGICSYYRRFIKNFSEISVPLTELTRKNQKFKWNPEAEQSFQILKEKLSRPPILIHPNYDKDFILSCDASDHSIAATLGQADRNGIIHPISYFSKKLSPAQTRYTILEKELLAIVQAIKSYKYYLYGRHFIVQCDNEALTKMSTLDSPGNRITRWFDFLKDYNFKFQSIKSEENIVADALSRDFHVNAVQIDVPNVSQIKDAQACDENLKIIIADLNNNKRKSKYRFDYYLSDGILMHTAQIPSAGRYRKVNQLVIPDKYKPHILAANHLTHFGHIKTYNAIREKYFWTNLYADTKHYVKSCHHCMSYKSNNLPPVPLQRHHIPSRPLEYVSADYIGVLPYTNNGNRYILSFQDHFTKYIRLYATPDQTAQTTAEKFLDYASLFGFPEFLLSDKGKCFVSDLFENLCKRLGVLKLKTTALNPKCNGMTECLNKGIKKSLSIFARDTAQWDQYLQYYALIYNSTIHSTTKEKPAFLHLSYDPTLPTDVLEKSLSHNTSYDSYPSFVDATTTRLQYTFKKVQESLLQAAENQENYQHQFAKYRDFYVGQLVYLYWPNHDRNIHLPKTRKYIGPFRILKIHNKVNFTISDPNDPKKKPQKVNAQRLIPYTERRAELDYLRAVIKETSHSMPPQNESPRKSPPRFEEISENELLLSSALRASSMGSRNDSEQTESPPSPPPPSSDSTQSYDFQLPSPKDTNINTQGTRHKEHPSHNYNLRPRPNLPNETPNVAENIANRILNWSLAVTNNNTTSAPSAAIQFLNKCSEALK